MFLKSLNMFYLGNYSVPGTVLDTEDETWNKADRAVALLEFIFSRKAITRKQPGRWQALYGIGGLMETRYWSK